MCPALHKALGDNSKQDGQGPTLTELTGNARELGEAEHRSSKV